MKTKSLWFATAAAVVLTGMTMMTSCSKDDYELPEVIESEVYDEGEAGEVRAEVGTEGTQLSYESWIMVRGITRASFDNKVSVTLNNAFNNVDSVIEVGSFIGMAAMTRSELTIKNVSYENLGIIPDSFRRLGIKMEQWEDDIYVPAQETYQIESFIDGSIMTIADAPWPGLTPDLLSVLLVVATQAKGSVLIHQKMFESRLFFVDKLIDMGAQIILCDPHRAVVIGHDHGFKLRGGNMTSPDIRAGIALLIAAMSADGISRIHNIEQIDRGYQNIEGRLNALGARITRIE